MIVKREKLNFWEKLYLPAIWGGLKVTMRHALRKNVTMQYPEVKWTVPPGYRGAPYLVKNQEGRVKCVACQLCEFVCPPKAIRITPGTRAEHAPDSNVEKEPQQFKIDMLRCIYCGLCEEVCPEEAIFLKNDCILTSYQPTDLVLDKAQLLKLGGTH